MIILMLAYLCKRFNLITRIYSVVLVTQVPAVTLAACYALAKNKGPR
jgi:hypothetical protein